MLKFKGKQVGLGLALDLSGMEVSLKKWGSLPLPRLGVLARFGSTRRSSK